MPIGMGYSVEKQILGNEDRGDLQIEIARDGQSTEIGLFRLEEDEIRPTLLKSGTPQQNGLWPGSVIMLNDPSSIAKGHRRAPDIGKAAFQAMRLMTNMRSSLVRELNLPLGRRWGEYLEVTAVYKIRVKIRHGFLQNFVSDVHRFPWDTVGSIRHYTMLNGQSLHDLDLDLHLDGECLNDGQTLGDLRISLEEVILTAKQTKHDRQNGQKPQDTVSVAVGAFLTAIISCPCLVVFALVNALQTSLKSKSAVHETPPPKQTSHDARWNISNSRLPNRYEGYPQPFQMPIQQPQPKTPPEQPPLPNLARPSYYAYAMPTFTSAEFNLPNSDSANFSTEDEDGIATDAREGMEGLAAAAMREAGRQDREDKIQRETGQNSLSLQFPAQNKNSRLDGASGSESNIPLMLGAGIGAVMSYGGSDPEDCQTEPQEKVSEVVPSEETAQMLREGLLSEGKPSKDIDTASPLPTQFANSHAQALRQPGQPQRAGGRWGRGRSSGLWESRNNYTTTQDLGEPGSSWFAPEVSAQTNFYPAGAATLPVLCDTRAQEESLSMSKYGSTVHHDKWDRNEVGYMEVGSPQRHTEGSDRHLAAQDDAFERDYVMVDKRFVEANALPENISLPSPLGHNREQVAVRRTTGSGTSLPSLAGPSTEPNRRRSKHMQDGTSLRPRQKSPSKQARPRAQWSIGISAGGLIRQQIFADTEANRSWDLASSTLVNIQILNSVAYESLTSMLAPATPIDANTYLRQGIPFYELFDERLPALAGAEPFATIRSVGNFDASDNIRVGSSLTADMKIGCTCCRRNLCDAILRPCNHSFCSVCVCERMFQNRAVRCWVCGTIAEQTVGFSAPMSLPGQEKVDLSSTWVISLTGIYAEKNVQFRDAVEMPAYDTDA